MSLVKKVAYIGAHSSAKTTTVNRLSQFLKDMDIPYVVVPEVPRDCPLPFNQEGGLSAQLWMVNEQIRRELGAENYANDTIHELLKEEKYTPKNLPEMYVICDRSLWDYLAYSRSLARKGTMTPDDLRVITKQILGLVATMKPYDTIYFCETKPLYEDGVRDTDPEWQGEIYNCFKQIIKDYGLKVTVVQ